MKTFVFMFNYEKSALRSFVEKNRMSHKKNVLVQVYTKNGDRAHIYQVRKQLRQIIPNARIIGLHTEGKVINGEMNSEETMLVFSIFDNTTVKTTALNLNQTPSSFEAGVKLADQMFTQTTKVLFLFASSIHIDHSEFIQGIHSVAPNVTIAGGSPADNGTFRESTVFTDAAVYKNGVVFAALDSDSLHVHTATHSDWKRIGKSYTVTKANKEKLVSVDGMPVKTLYEKYLGQDVAAQLPGSTLQFPLVSEDGNRFHFAKKIYKNGTISLFNKINEGDTVQFAYGDNGQSLSSARALISSLKTKPTESIFMFTSAMARNSLQQSLDIELLSLKKIGVVSGFFTHAEFSQTGATSHSVTVLTLSEKNKIPKTKNSAEIDPEGLVAINEVTALSNLVAASTEELSTVNKILSDLEQRYQSLFDHGPICLYSLDCEGNVINTNPAFAKQLGYSQRDVQNTSVLSYIAEEDREMSTKYYLLVLDGIPQRFSLKLKHREGHLLTFNVTKIPIVIDGHIVGIYGIAENIMKQRQDEEKIAQLSFYDSLTELPNRLAFQQMLEVTMAWMEYKQRQMAVMFIDIDRFKVINDSFGHYVGDQILKQAVKRIKNAISNNDFLARFNGNQFILLVPSVSGKDEVLKKAENILKSLKGPLVYNDEEIFLSASIGISLFPNDGNTDELLLKNADSSLSRAKQMGGGKVKSYKQEIAGYFKERLKLESHLRKALDKNQFTIHYQPQISSETGDVFGCEALIRWHHPECGMILPGEFIPLAEETGLIEDIGSWVLHTACYQTKRWQEQGHGILSVSVNVSGRQFQSFEFLEDVKEALNDSSLPPESLHLELTESMTLRDVDYSIQLVKALKDLGVKVSIDDFGTGHSALSYLKDFSVDILKIDRSFIKDLKKGNKDSAIIKAILTMCEGLSLTTVAEGVETEEQLELLKSFGCNTIQGFFYSKPLPVSEFEQFMNKKSNS